MGTPKTGDRVRVTFEADYREPYDYGGHVVSFDFPDYRDYRATVPADANLEILPKPLKVGDTIKGEAAYEALPLGAMLEPDVRWGEFGHLVRVKDGFIRTTRPDEFHREGAFFDPRVIAYLPDSAA